MVIYLLVILLVYLGASILTYFIADRLLFQPPPPSYQDSDRIIKLKVGDEATLSAVFLPAPEAFHTILFCHGNGEDLGQITPLLAKLNETGFSVFAFDYEGYGTSSGKPSEKGFYRDTEAAFNYLVKDLKIPAHRLIVHGRSVGGAVAVELARKKNLGGIIIESSFLSANRVKTQIPIFLFDRFKTISKIGKISCPVLFIHGKKDEIVPFRHGRILFEKAGKPKFSLWLENAGHAFLMQIAEDKYKKSLQNFSLSLRKNSPQA